MIAAAPNCDHRAPQHEPPHARSRIQKVIGVVSGKGGVGKSMTSAMLAVSMRRLGFKAGVLDADITGPSIPRLFGVKGPATGDGEHQPGFQPYRPASTCWLADGRRKQKEQTL